MVKNVKTETYQRKGTKIFAKDIKDTKRILKEFGVSSEIIESRFEEEKIKNIRSLRALECMRNRTIKEYLDSIE